MKRWQTEDGKRYFLVEKSNSDRVHLLTRMAKKVFPVEQVDLRKDRNGPKR
jgi:hypothetical protein